MRSMLKMAQVILAMSIVVACGNGDPEDGAATRVAAPAKRAMRKGEMSPAGRLAGRALRAVNGPMSRGPLGIPVAAVEDRGPGAGESGDADEEGGGPGALEDGGDLPGGNQGELAIAVDDTGRNVVIGFNDFRGFSSTNPALSISGYAFSHDGGKTFTDGGQLPVDTFDPATGLPQVFGDPDVKYLGDCNFIYTSIVVAPFGDPAVGAAVQTMGFHRSRDCGETWEGPFEITSASNPSGIVIDGFPNDAADKEFMDVDRATGRVLVSWTNFSDATEISSTYSDDVLLATPTWSPRVILGARDGVDGQGSIPRFGPVGSNLVYVAWHTTTSVGVMNDIPVLLQGISAVTSTDNGMTFGAPVDLTPGTLPPDQVPGNDRIHAFPSMTVDRSNGPNRGTVYVTYLNNDAQDGGDIIVQTSTNKGRSFGSPVKVNARPGHDRSQWFPAAATNDRSGRTFVFFYDQGVADSGDRTQLSYTFSDNGGRKWAAPRRLSPHVFRAGWGNDSSQPNLGDYNGAVVGRDGTLLGAYAVTHAVEFRDNQPFGTYPVPEPEVGLAAPSRQVAVTTVDLRGTKVGEVRGFSNRNGFLDAGETATVNVSIRNNVTNPMSARPMHPIIIAETHTPGAHLLVPLALFRELDPGQTATSLTPLVVRLDSSFNAGQDVNIVLHVASLEGIPVDLEATLHTGTPIATPLLAESFDAAAPGTLPDGWTSRHGAGANEVPWTTSDSFCGTSNAAFHVNAVDGATPVDDARWERLLSPVFTVPADAEWVEVELDVCTDTEDDPRFNVQAYDGLFLRVTNLTPTDLAFSSGVEAFETDFTTGASENYPKHLPRNGNPGYFQDMSVWGGDSGGRHHVKIRLPGMAGTTAQLRFEFTQDDNSTCADIRPGHSCGVLVDNVTTTAFKSN